MMNAGMKQHKMPNGMMMTNEEMTAMMQGKGGGQGMMGQGMMSTAETPQRDSVSQKARLAAIMRRIGKKG